MVLVLEQDFRCEKAATFFFSVLPHFSCFGSCLFQRIFSYFCCCCLPSCLPGGSSSLHLAWTNYGQQKKKAIISRIQLKKIRVTKAEAIVYMLPPTIFCYSNASKKTTVLYLHHNAETKYNSGIHNVAPNVDQMLYGSNFSLNQEWKIRQKTKTYL